MCSVLCRYCWDREKGWKKVCNFPPKKESLRDGKRRTRNCTATKRRWCSETTITSVLISTQRSRTAEPFSCFHLNCSTSARCHHIHAVVTVSQRRVEIHSKSDEKLFKSKSALPFVVVDRYDCSPCIFAVSGWVPAPVQQFNFKYRAQFSCILKVSPRLSAEIIHEGGEFFMLSFVIRLLSETPGKNNHLKRTFSIQNSCHCVLRCAEFHLTIENQRTEKKCRMKIIFQLFSSPFTRALKDDEKSFLCWFILTSSSSRKLGKCDFLAESFSSWAMTSRRCLCRITTFSFFTFLFLCDAGILHKISKNSHNFHCIQVGLLCDSDSAFYGFSLGFCHAGWLSWHQSNESK